MATEVFQIVSETNFGVHETVKGKGGRTKRIYRCRHCSRLFKRSEHCARHERVHTQERPFPCAFCERKYARKDLVKRHERSLHAEEYRKAHPEEFRRYSLNSAGHGDSGGEGSAVTSDSNHHPPSPLTPLTPVEIAPSNPTVHLVPTMPLPTHSPLRSLVPPPSTADRELCFTTSPIIDSSIGPDLYSLEVEFNSTLQTDTISPFFDISAPDPGSLHKRRRIEIDPRLEATMCHSLPLDPLLQDPIALQPTNTSPVGANDLSFTRGGPLSLQNQSPPTDGDILLVPQCDSFVDYSAFFNLDSPVLSSQLDRDRQSSQSLSPVQIEGCIELPKFTFTESIHAQILDDARSRLPAGELSEALFPSANDLNRFFAGYLDCFHRHFPVIHLPSLDLRETPSPLIFAMCSIGAQYRLARQKAKNLFALAGTMSSYALRGGLPISSGTPKPAPLWIMQTRVLLSLCGMFSGKTNVVLRMTENLGLFAIDYRLRKADLTRQNETQLEWEEWIEKESSKRLLCGMFIVSNLIATTYGMTPGFSHTFDLEFEVLSDEKLWNARSTQEWAELRDTRPVPCISTIREVMSHMIFKDQPGQELGAVQISGLTMLLIMHAINVYMLNLRQVIGPLGGFDFNQSSYSELHDTLLNSAFSTLTRCQNIITSVRGNVDHETTYSDTEGPLMCNCQALLLISYIRLFSNIGAFNRLTLLTDNPDDIAPAVRSYAESLQLRSPRLTKAVTKAYEQLLSTVRIGHMFLRKTAAFRWSLEHAVAGWDATLLLTKWAHTMELERGGRPPNAEELYVLDGLKDLLVEGEPEADLDDSTSLAAAVAHFCSTTLNDVWVWGITPRMGNVLEQLAKAYEEHYEKMVAMGLTTI